MKLCITTLRPRLLNRRAFYATNYLGVAIVDFDSLKWINDNAGHCVGDEYLSRLANELKKTFGEEKVFRLGGDEFGVVGNNLHEINQRLIDLRRRVPFFSFGIGPKIERADDYLRLDKERRQKPAPELSAENVLDGLEKVSVKLTNEVA